MDKSLKLKLIKSIHVISRLPVYLYDDHFQLKLVYVADRVHALPYDFKELYGLQKETSFLFSGILDEVFISYSYPGATLIIGPFTTSPLTNAIIEERVHQYTNNQELWPHLIQYLKLLPFFSLGDVRDFLIHLNFLFTGNAECPYSEDLHLQVAQNRILFAEEKLKNCDWRVFQSDYYAYSYEKQLLRLVQEGSTEKLRESLATLSNSVTPANSREPLRAEKNYTIIVLEKLSTLAIQSGHDIPEIYQLRDFYIQLMEEKEKLIDVLYVRDCAIIHFTELMHNFANQHYSPLIRSIIQHIGLNLYSVIKVSVLSKEFFISEATLCSRFKKETGVSIIEYVHQRKVAEAKLLLKSGLPPTEVAISLSYYDYSHFSKTFKKLTGLSPKAFQLGTAHAFA